MRVLWFTNIPMPAMDDRFGSATQGSGYWMISLLNELSGIKNITIAVATAWPGVEDMHFEDNGIRYFVMGQSRGTSHLKCSSRDVKECKKIIIEFVPDIIHIHGTERFYGMLATDRDITEPIVISVQGILNQIVLHYFGRMNLLEILACSKPTQFLRGYGLLFDYFRTRNATKRENEIIKSAKFFLGRTAWDRSHVLGLNPTAAYFQVNETIRPQFFIKQWCLSYVQRHSIIFTNARSPLRNTETLIEAVKILDKRYGDVTLRLSGNVDLSYGYGKHIAGLISRHGLWGKVSLLGYLDENQMVEHMLRSHVFCNASWLENSPNSLCEAQLLGMPCIGGNVGGIPSLISDGVDGLLFPPSDPAVLAETINSVFCSDTLAESIGASAHRLAVRRHDVKHIINQLVTAYTDTIRLHGEGRGIYHA
jgi:L-malate glycosyltransferase